MAPWVLAFAILATLGLLAALFLPRRRLWVKTAPAGHTLRVEYAGLARGEDPTLDDAVGQFAQRHGDAFESALHSEAGEASAAASSSRAGRK